MTRKAAPWIFSENPIMKIWSWDSPHFNAKIISSPAGDFTWEVIDITGSEPATIGAGEVDYFQQAEDEVLELVAKSYPRNLGYHAYAGDLATTFTMHNGTKENFAKYYGKNVVVTVFNKNAPMTPATIIGNLSIKNFKIIIRNESNTSIAIPPEYIMKIKREYDSFEALVEDTRKTEATSGKRLIKEDWRPGCTGQAGFTIGTVIHSPTDAPCPFHD